MKEDLLFCPQFCKYLSPNELLQKQHEPHWCLKFDKRVIHNGCHPAIFRCHECYLLVKKAEEAQLCDG